jgi:dolichol-phosphate mannosyltransferase
MSVWVILPTYNEAENLETIVAAVLASVPGVHVLVVDDSSPDGTGAIADRIAGGRGDVEVLHRPRKSGLGRAYVAGFEHALRAGAGSVVEMDADLSHDPADLPRLLAPLAEGADLVLGSRYVPGGGIRDWDALRRGISRFGCEYARRVLGVPVRDLTGGFKAFRASALEAIDYASVRFRERQRGDSKMSAMIALEAAWLVPALRYGRRREAGSGEPADVPMT